ncbi:hypothetical protein M378DRAFT_73147 [Amanita muscaria Koide BX008]|uniref:CRAL-TRIO domain-containing protein n=1 Tax=Amanita muscaria (strain Koide BX008) TaxID=946122 RepID=A0A0C2XGD7_AMAMK|nr:hypothetical protein M378DRAFT_73147 [Amanita muscaria Koide BX008]
MSGGSSSDTAQVNGIQPGHIDVFAGHLGHLTKEQEEVFATFKENLISAKLYTAPSDTSPASHDDTTLLRFLRARTFQPVPAQKQFADAEAWRKHHDVDRLYASFNAEELESTKRFYPRWTGRRDRNGIPLYVYRIQSIVPIQSELEAVPPNRRLQRIIALYELMVRFSFGLCSHLPHPSYPTPISSTTTIIDLQDASISALWRLRGHLQESSQLATSNYPETLHSIVVVNSPSFFPTIWGWIKGWFDERTRNKIFVLGKDPGPKLREMIDPNDLPKVYGGELEWRFGDEPKLDEDAERVIKAMPKGPAIFVDGTVVKLQDLN